ncbi:MAG TPA: sialidase family protein, partial [Ktedonobacterales bacterium]|nr:sialidase family protein [Ktedonobacterales bacterium]
CHLVPDAVDARHIALGAQTDAGAAAGCPTSRLFASSDGGMHWSSVALPGLLARACVVFLSPASGTLVLWSYGMPASTGVPADARIWISLDSGATWHVASTGLPSGIVESVVSARADGALLVLMRRSEAGTGTATPAPATSELWSCPAGCPRWQRVALVPGSAPTVFATANGWLSTGSGWGTLYAVGTVPGDASTEQTPDTPTATTSVVAGPIYVSSGAHADTWHPLPPMPWSAAEIGMPAEFTGPSRIVGVGPDGALVLEAQNAGVVLEPATATQGQSAAGVLSMWDPRDGRWLSPALIEPAASTVLAVVWDEQGANGARRLTIWFDTRSGDVWPMVVPNSDWQVAQMAPRCQRCQ